MEEWRVIPTADRYEASSVGRVRNSGSGLILKQKMLKDGYWGICLYPIPGQKIYPKTHQVIALAFLGPAPFPRAVVAHKDGTRTNNAPDNLYWATFKQNHADRERHGRAPKGSRNGAARLNEASVERIRALLSRGAVQARIAEQFDVCTATISHINTGKYWRHTA